MANHQKNSSRPVTTSQPTRALFAFDNQWHSTYCGSFSPCSRSAFACCCLCCHVAKLVDRTGDNPLTCLCNPCVIAGLRTKVRTAFRIRGTLMGDCCQAICCPCAAMQIERELDYRTLSM